MYQAEGFLGIEERIPDLQPYLRLLVGIGVCCLPGPDLFGGVGRGLFVVEIGSWCGFHKQFGLQPPHETNE